MTKVRAEPEATSIDDVRAAAEAGDAAAQLDLANRCYFGDGIGHDPDAAYRWMRKAAEAGVAEAQSKVGYFLRCGVGVPRDPRAAIGWFRRALRGGYAKAAYNLGDMFRVGREVPCRPRRARVYFETAVAMGQEAANYGLAVLHYSGLGVPRDVGKALGHLRRGLRGGDPEAIVEMGRFFRDGVARPEDLAEAEARALAFHRPGDPDSLRLLFDMRREACAPPPPPPFLDELNAELDRRQAIGREPEPSELDAASRADSESAFRAATRLYHGRSVPRDVPRALELLESLVRAGNADAARFLALAYDGFGGGVAKDPGAAMRWWNEGARLGDPHASWFVGKLLLEDGASPADRARGRELIEDAAGRGFPPACGYVGYLRARDCPPGDALLEKEAIPLLRLGAVRGDTDAARFLAMALQELGGPARLEEAFYWLHRATRRSAAAASALGEAFWRGIGVPCDPKAAAAWFDLAVREGDLHATIPLGEILFAGDGVPTDPAAAAALLRKAADAGDAMACGSLGLLYDEGIGLPRDAGEAVRWLERGVDGGDACSAFGLAGILFDGRGVDPDASRAAGLLERAATHGVAEASHLLALMTFRGEGVPPDADRARQDFLVAVSREHLPSLFTTLEAESLRHRPAALRPRDLRATIEALDRDRDALPADSALDVGLVFWNGDAGFPRERPRASELFRVSARKGNALAAACLSRALERLGEVGEAMEWLETAARSGLPGAQRHLAFRLVSPGGASWDDDRVVRLLESAAAAGDPVACAELARVLESSGSAADAGLARRVEALKRCAVEGGYPEELPDPG